MTAKTAGRREGTVTGPALGAGLAALALAAAPLSAGESRALGEMTLEQLMQLPVVTAAKKPEPWFTSSAAVTVITGDELRRSGATTIAEALRLAPGVQVSRVNGNQWAVSIRGFANTFANKLLVLVDGRSVYSPLFSGTFWDVADTLLEDVDRIEVVRGPGGTLWGENAVNGVINVITKDAHDTHGWLAGGGSGTQELGFGSARYGGQAGKDLHYRFFGKYFDRAGQRQADGSEAPDRWKQGRAGFRADWDASPADQATFLGEFYRGQNGESITLPVKTAPFSRLATGEGDVSGGHVLGRWKRRLRADSEVTAQAYYEGARRSRVAGFNFSSNIIGLDLQHRFRWTRQETLWGLGARFYDDTTSGGNATFTPADRTTRLWSGFVQDDVAVVEERLRLTAGSKFERNDYTGFEFQPSARLLWTPAERHAAWAAVSRALRAPSRSDEDLSLTASVRPPPPAAIPQVATGNPDFLPEELIAYEAGYRMAVNPRLNFDAAAFYNSYHRLRLFVALPVAPGPVLPALQTNQRGGETHGVEVAARWQATPRWRLRGSFTLLRMYLSPDAQTQADQNGDSPRHQASVVSAFDLPHAVELDTDLRYSDALPNKFLPRSVLADVRLAWRPTPALEAAVVGQNLLEAQHPEFSATGVLIKATEVRPGVYASLTWRY